MTTAIEARNARVPKLEATRAVRARAEALAALVSSQVRAIGTACTTNDDAFAPEALAAVAGSLTSIKASVAELETLAAEIQATWSAE